MPYLIKLSQKYERGDHYLYLICNYQKIIDILAVGII